MAIGEIRKLRAAIMVLDIAGSSKYSEQEFHQYLSPILHMIFHIVQTRQGVVDKYTGDGAMISFCNDAQDDKWACSQAINTSLDISQLILYLKKKYNFPDVQIRIGIDFGVITVEQIGVRGRTQLIIIGESAIAAKRMESICKSKVFLRDSIGLCVGYDVFHNLSKELQKMCDAIVPPYAYSQFIQKKKSLYQKGKYRIFEYIGRYTEKRD